MDSSGSRKESVFVETGKSMFKKTSENLLSSFLQMPSSKGRITNKLQEKITPVYFYSAFNLKKIVL